MYRWLDYILTGKANATSARYLGEAPATPAACAYMNCTAVHAGDEAWWSRLSFARTPQHDCHDAPRRGVRRLVRLVGRLGADPGRLRGTGPRRPRTTIIERLSDVFGAHRGRLTARSPSAGRGRRRPDRDPQDLRRRRRGRLDRPGDRPGRVLHHARARRARARRRRCGSSPGSSAPTRAACSSAASTSPAGPPYDRDVNTVFQDYALFPHMTVAANVEYGLRVKGVKRHGAQARAAGGARARPPGRASATASPCSSRAGSASGSRSRGRSSTTRRCCSSTSRSARST